MAAVVVQQGDTGAGNIIADGTQATLLTKAGASLPNITAGHAVVMSIISVHNGANDVSTVVTTFGTFTRVNSISAGTMVDIEFWVCLNATGGGNQVTVTTVSGASYVCQATEVSGASLVITNTTNSGNSTAPALTLAPQAAGNIAFINVYQANGTITGLTAAFTAYNGGEYTWVNGFDVGYEVVPSSASVSPTYTAPTGPWETIGLVLGGPGFVQGTTVNVTALQTTLTPALTGIAANDSLILSLVTNRTAGQGASSVSGAGATWDLVVTIANANGNVEIWVGTGCSAGTATITVTLAATLTAGCRLDEWAGLITSGDPDDQNTAVTGTSATIASPAFITTEINELVYLLSDATTAETANPAAPWTNEVGPTTASVQLNGIAYQVFASSGSSVASTSWTQTLGGYNVVGTVLRAAAETTPVRFAIGTYVRQAVNRAGTY